LFDFCRVTPENLEFEEGFRAVSMRHGRQTDLTASHRDPTMRAEALLNGR